MLISSCIMLILPLSDVAVTLAPHPCQAVAVLTATVASTTMDSGGRVLFRRSFQLCGRLSE